MGSGKKERKSMKSFPLIVPKCISEATYRNIQFELDRENHLLWLVGDVTYIK